MSEKCYLLSRAKEVVYNFVKNRPTEKFVLLFINLTNSLSIRCFFMADLRTMSTCSDLEAAAAAGKRDFVKLLIHEGADVNHSNDFGWTPVMHAARNGRSSVVSELVYNNAGMKYLTKLGLTPLMMAACNGHYAVVDLLIGRGANPNTVNAAHQTALDVASCKGYRDIQNLLIKKMDVQNVTPSKSCSESIDFPSVDHHLQTENIFSPSSEENLRMWSQFTNHQAMQFHANYGSRNKASPFSNFSVESCCQQQNVLSPRPHLTRSHFCQQNCGSASPYSAYSFTKCCYFSPHPNYQGLTNLLTPPHNHMYSYKSQGTENKKKWSRRMSQSDPNLSKRDKKSIAQWWKVATEKLHSKVKNRKKAMISSKIVKSLKFGSDNCQNDRRGIEDYRQASRLTNYKESHSCSSSPLSISFKGRTFTLENFLHSCGLQDYFHIFAQQEVDIHTIYSLTVEDLEEMGIVNPREQIKILKSIAFTKRKQ